MNVDKMIGTWSDYDPWQRLWPGIDEKMGNRCRELQSSNYGEFVKKENKGMETKYSYSPCKERYRIPSIVKVIYDLSQVFFCLSLTCYIAEMESFC